MKKILPLLIPLAVLIAGCDVKLPSEGTAQEGFNVSGFAAPLSEYEYSRLGNEQQYQVANKLLGSMYRGIAVADFYDISQGMDRLALKEGEQFLSSVETALSTPLDSATREHLNTQIRGDAEAGIEARFSFTSRQVPKQLPLAQIYQYPLSKDFFDRWIAWHLANNILFSPAEEIDSVNVTDVQKVYTNLVEDLRNNKTIREIIKRHQNTQENWRRFRSPEDNTREMIEIYLGLFDRDEDVPRASMACKEWYLTDENQGYERVRNGEPNTEPQLVLDSYVTTCEDFYELIAQHPLVIGRVTTVLVEYFFAGRSNADRLKIVESIVTSNPETFQDIFKGILFSREYLLKTERPRSFEENFLGSSHRLEWRAPTDLFQGMVSRRGGAYRANMTEMSWPAMSLKLGRLFGVPMDSLSFAHYHKAYRELLLFSRDRWRKGLGLIWIDEPAEDATAEELALYEMSQQRFSVVGNMSVNDFIDYLFLSAAMRRADAVEKTTLTTIALDVGFVRNKNGKDLVREDYHDDFARLVFDYISRLPESYYFKAID